MSPDSTPPSGRWEVVCCSLESWDDVWRRNQFLADHLLRTAGDSRILFVEPPVDVVWSLMRGRPLRSKGLRPIGGTGRLWAFEPRKILPRRLSRQVDRRLCRRVLHVIRQLGFRDPILWINDSSYAEFPSLTGYPSVYDVTDDWNLVGRGGREHQRQVTNDRILLGAADEVVVCSPALARSRGQERQIHLITNAVDIDHFRAPRPRPPDLPTGPVVLYSGTLSEGRLDIDLSLQLARALSGRATLVFVGPDACGPESTNRLIEAGALLLGSRPYRDIPAYLQHADVLVVPHVVNAFTESLDPIKAREFLAVGRPVVSTPVAGFRDLPAPVATVDRGGFAAVVMKVLDEPGPEGIGPLPGRLPSWSESGDKFLAVLEAARAGRRSKAA